ncbi:anhydro-N-acetylmuramic acid kinase [Derxia gummosa]|uniref:Anhydro-N-acetylmuramic acid kinase n=1 Tax=Derxia gummosa DSM 723 TaxID=1121388 RepID=A0A9U5GQE2_9BURK|nr:anhydro-N-acetylmuramic acid kinase [Derxia gummosa]
MLCIGLMSGTSLDGIDGVLVRFSADAAPAAPRAAALLPGWPANAAEPDAKPTDAMAGTVAALSSGDRPTLLGHVHRPFPPALRTELLALQRPVADELHRAAVAAVGVADAYAEVVAALLPMAADEPVAVIGAHGQTVRHRPECGYTLQLLDGARLAERSGITVIGDLRSRDIAAGGQGAPLVPAFHAAVFGTADGEVLVANIGGIANVSRLGADGSVTGHDVGPGNVLLDLWVERHLGEPFDRNGAWASIGDTDDMLLDELLDEEFFDRAPPKSTGRDLFNADWLDRKLAAWSFLAPEDVQRTLVELTAIGIAREVTPRTARVIVCGGGARNAELMLALSAHVALTAPDCVVGTSAEHGVAPEHVEAMAFAWLAMRHERGLPGNLPAVTGAQGVRLLGARHPA